MAGLIWEITNLKAWFKIQLINQFCLAKGVFLVDNFSYEKSSSYLFHGWIFVVLKNKQKTMPLVPNDLYTTDPWKRQLRPSVRSWSCAALVMNVVKAFEAACVRKRQIWDQMFGWVFFTPNFWAIKRSFEQWKKLWLSNERNRGWKPTQGW